MQQMQQMQNDDEKCETMSTSQFVAKLVANFTNLNYTKLRNVITQCATIEFH